MSRSPSGGLSSGPWEAARQEAFTKYGRLDAMSAAYGWPLRLEVHHRIPVSQGGEQ